ncbi:Signal peptide peptidase 5 [Trichostrongylus colubriformis]|uniref:Signal peptide peptidase 5 n=1 Tax=Trichostrongylus colubriformis TaxID=6319 RepID=A0AAN8FRW0_TRICO
MNSFSEHNRIFYGILYLFGYGFGLTFVAVALTGMAQPALLYLVPCTLIPMCRTAYVRGHLRLLWYSFGDLAVTTARPSETRASE